jgi:hypothetical protein
MNDFLKAFEIETLLSSTQRTTIVTGDYTISSAALTEKDVKYNVS